MTSRPSVFGGCGIDGAWVKVQAFFRLRYVGFSQVRAGAVYNGGGRAHRAAHVRPDGASRPPVVVSLPFFSLGAAVLSS
jgi:hypothetical protein